jgi:hypothetical protein
MAPHILLLYLKFTTLSHPGADKADANSKAHGDAVHGNEPYLAVALCTIILLEYSHGLEVFTGLHGM